jgi:hypothetical protein
MVAKDTDFEAQVEFSSGFLKNTHSVLVLPFIRTPSMLNKIKLAVKLRIEDNFLTYPFVRENLSEQPWLW